MKCYSNVLGLLAVVAISLCHFSRVSEGAALVKNFYRNSCPRAEQTVQGIIYNRVAGNPELPAKLLRLFFHDCFVRGCDASILLDSTTNNTAEKSAGPNLSLAGFDVLEEVKAALEYACPGVVSCADIIALAARDSVSYQFRKNFWEVRTGRRDGNVSLASEAFAQLPSPFANFAALARSFKSNGLGVKDLVVLSGAHTLGISHCNLFSKRIYNFTGKGDVDPSFNATYAEWMRSQCHGESDSATVVPMNPRSSTLFDNQYYALLKERMGLLQSDAALLTSKKALGYVDQMLARGDASYFLAAFKSSITRMGGIGVLTGTDHGEIRKICSAVN